MCAAATVQQNPQKPQKAMLPLQDAVQKLLDAVVPLTQVQWVHTLDADGRVLAQDVTSGLSVPSCDNSAMDGYAVASQDVTTTPTTLPVSQRIPAGSQPVALQQGTAARIFTGAQIPPGADAVVIQEDCTAREDAAGASLVDIHKAPKVGLSIRRTGEDVALGSVVLRSGDRLGPAQLGLAASVGMDQLPVCPRPRVALFSTGDELIMPGTVPPAEMPPGAIYNSNRYFLASLLRRLGCEVTDFGIIPDQRDATLAVLRDAARSHNVILTSGGVSVGEEDHVRPAVQSLGSLDNWLVAIKPGKPFAHGRIGDTHFLGLPGNPVSSLITFLVLVRPFLLRLQGVRQVQPRAFELPAHFEWLRADRRQEFLRVRINDQGGLDLFPNQSSGVLTSAVWGDGLVDNPPTQVIRHGDRVRFLSFTELMA